MDYLKEAKENFNLKDNSLCCYATKNSEAERINEDDDDIRSPFFQDIDRIIHAYSYTRYLDKTQVFTNSYNDHISKRITHVQLVSKIARTICRALRLNEDLAEAIALGHDIGHTPLGHSGEAMLNKISKRELNEVFQHNIQGVRHYMNVEKNGLGLNLTIQVLDGILTHNGEILENIYKVDKKTKSEFLDIYNNSYKESYKLNKIHPMTIEGCVVRISDIIAYIGRDIEDAIILNKIKREDIPNDIIKVLGDNNKDIVNNIILDIIKNSMNKSYIKMSKSVYNALMLLKKFNYENIYSKSMSKDDYKYYEDGMNKLFKIYLNDIDNNKNSIIYKYFLNNQNDIYNKNTSNKRKVIDFIAGMTDDFLTSEIKKYE